ncbi:MAG: DNA primase [Candidatus Cloacimonetes bacterium]|nr:DNA primase [Candidatus Cloacimonadota bacterium]MCF7814016.1 DNA primase [Candidatus Cloacimonadota bacterium]MCF7868080.1 DNA primase [Candidatus Cloacimonadota bacterium]MCF7883503.1 DNA primase [Candidatus Cloacimonadota bacterium]
MDQRIIEEVIDNNNIVDVIGSYFPLKKTGSNFKARCPFHDEKTASFVVSEKKQIFKCFGCGKGGNVIHFVQEYEKLSFWEAMKKLAQRAGIVLQQSPVNTKKKNRRDLIYSIYKLAGEFFCDNLFKHGDFALRYLSERGFSNDAIQKFQIGYALDGFNSLKNYLIKNSINDKILPNTGLFTQGGSDLFRNRLMFPIHDHTGKIIAFGGRILHDDQSGGKYVNSPTTEIYTKGNELYGLFLTKYEIQKKDTVLICEGYTDFLRLYEKGFTNCVASLGTSLTDGQIKLLGRYTNNFYMIYDGDKAGRKAAVRAAGNVIEHGYKAYIIQLPSETDPDSYLQENDAAKLNDLISNALSLPKFLQQDKSLQLEERAKLDTLIEILNEMNDEISQELFIKDISEIFGISEHAIRTKIKKRKPNRTKVTTQKTLLNKFEDEKNLICLILDNKILYKKVAQEIDSTYFFSDAYKSIFGIMQEHIEDMGQISSLVDYTDDEIIKSTITELMMLPVPNTSVDENINNLKLRKFQTELKYINTRIRENPKDRDLLSQKNELKKKVLTLDKRKVTKTLY